MDIFSSIFSLPIISIIAIILIAILLLSFIIKIFTLPIRTAERRNLSNDECVLITILTWCGLLAGITWIIALCLAYLLDEKK